jgi:hypothetical protein
LRSAEHEGMRTRPPDDALERAWTRAWAELVELLDEERTRLERGDADPELPALRARIFRLRERTSHYREVLRDAERARVRRRRALEAGEGD